MHLFNGTHFGLPLAGLGSTFPGKDWQPLINSSNPPHHFVLSNSKSQVPISGLVFLSCNGIDHEFEKKKSN